MCSECLCPADNEIKCCVDIGDISNVEIADEFCYPGDMSMDGDTDAAVTAGIRSVWFKFRSSFLTAKEKKMFPCCEETICDACIWSCMFMVVRCGH